MGSSPENLLPPCANWLASRRNPAHGPCKSRMCSNAISIETLSFIGKTSQRKKYIIGFKKWFWDTCKVKNPSRKRPEKEKLISLYFKKGTPFMPHISVFLNYSSGFKSLYFSLSPPGTWEKARRPNIWRMLNPIVTTYLFCLKGIWSPKKIVSRWRVSRYSRKTHDFQLRSAQSRKK